MDLVTLSTAQSNRNALLDIFRGVIPSQKWRLLEIGSGSGHHAIFLAAHFPELQWVTSDLAIRHTAIKKNLREAKLINVHGPLEFELGKDEFPSQKFNAVFASQFLHAVSWKQAKSLFKMLGNRLREGSQVMYFGPFKYESKLASERLVELDATLKQKDPQFGIRAFEDVLKSMVKAGFELKKDFLLLADNHLLFFERLKHEE